MGKVKGDVEKAKRKIEGDLKLTQEAVSDLERVKAELSGGVARKDKEGQAAEVQTELSGVQNRIKGEKQQKLALEGQIAKINSTVAQMEGEVKTQEGVLAGAEQDRADKD